MAGPTLIQIKRSDGTAIPASLANGEFAYSGNGDVLYIGSKSTVVPVAGKRFPGTLTANQYICTNSTNMVDVLRVGNSTVNAVVNQANLVLANSTVTLSVSLPTSAQVGVGSYFLGANGTWMQAPGGATTFDGMTDVTITTVANNQVVVYDNTAAQWVNKTVGNGFSFTAQAPAVLAGTNGGLSVNATGVWVIGANGITIDAGGVNVRAGTSTSGLVSNTTGVWAQAGNGISVGTKIDVAVGTSTSGLVSNTTGLWSLGGNAIAIAAGGGHYVSVGATAPLVANATGLWLVTGATTALSSNSTGVWVIAGQGIVSNSTGIFAKQANGISVDASGINVVAGTGVVSNSTGVHIGQAVGTGSNVTFNDVTVSGNLDVNGTLTTIDATNLQVTDSIIELARTNAADTLDIGIYGAYNDGSARFAGLMKMHGGNIFELFANTTAEPTTTLNTAGTGYVRAMLYGYCKTGWGTGTLEANSTGVWVTANSTWQATLAANSLTLTTALVGSSGGTGQGTTALGDLLIGAAGNSWSKLAVDASAGKLLQSNGTSVVYDTLDGGTF
jgi:hypothetical protein